MFKGLIGYLTAVLAFIVIGLLGYIAVLANWLHNAEEGVTHLEKQLVTCSSRISNIQEDIESDGKVNDLSNFTVPSEWMREDN